MTTHNPKNLVTVVPLNKMAKDIISQSSLKVMSDSVAPWTEAHQAPLSMESSRQEYCNGLPLLSPVDLPNTGTEPRSPALQADSLQSEPPAKTINTL